MLPGGGGVRCRRNFFGPLFLEFLDPPLDIISWPWDGKATKSWWWNQRFQKPITRRFLAICLTLIKYKWSSLPLHRSSTILLFHILFCNFKTSLVVDFSMMLKTCHKVRVSLDGTITLALAIENVQATGREHVLLNLTGSFSFSNEPTSDWQWPGQMITTCRLSTLLWSQFMWTTNESTEVKYETWQW